MFFRRNAWQVANQLGLVGWAGNEPDGTVKIVAEGPTGKLEELISWCKKGLPPAEVVKTEALWQKYSGEFNDFSIE